MSFIKTDHYFGDHTLTKGQYDRMVTNQGRPVNWRPNHYDRQGHLASTSLAPKGVKARPTRAQGEQR